MKLYFLDTFSGIGGFAYGAYRAGLRFDGHYYSEVNPYVIALYQKRFPEAIYAGDITKIKAQALPEGLWIVAGGFPCQDISCAGKGAGLAGSRSGLWRYYAKIIRDLRPEYAVIENVGALVRRGLGQVNVDLSKAGYDAEWLDIRASDVAALHQRERIWIVAYPRSADPEQPGLEGHRTQSGQTPHAEPWHLGREVSNTKSRGALQRDGQLRQDQQAGRSGGSHRGGASVNAKRQRWPSEPAVGCVVDGLPAGMDRYEGRLAHTTFQRADQLVALGNSIVPEIAELIFRTPAFDPWRYA